MRKIDRLATPGE